MARRQTLEPDVDRLYQVPLADFITARNALARGAPDAAAIRALQKPSLPAWAVNQLYWREPDVYRALVGSAADVRATHEAAARHGPADVRSASRAHEDAVDRALKATLGLVAESGQPVTDATRQAIATTLRGLPGDEPPGRLTRPLQPRGFELLTAAAATGRVRRPAGSTASGVAPAPTAAKGRPEAAARLAVTAAERATREAEQAYRRDEFEAARSARDADQRSRRARAAEDALAAAEEGLREARTARDAAVRAAASAADALENARARAARSAEQLAEARQREAAARKALGDASAR